MDVLNKDMKFVIKFDFKLDPISYQMFIFIEISLIEMTFLMELIKLKLKHRSQNSFSKSIKFSVFFLKYRSNSYVFV